VRESIGHASAKSTWKLQGLSIPRTTLQAWVTVTFCERYAKIRDHVASEVQRLAASEFEDMVHHAADVTHGLLDRLGKEIADVPTRDLAGAARNTATIAGIGVSNVQVARERPVRVVAHTRSVDEIFNALQAMGVLEGECTRCPSGPVRSQTSFTTTTTIAVRSWDSHVSSFST
jgi:hypothetical protein